MMTYGCCHVMGRTCLAPLVDEFTAAQRELGTHVGITEGEDLTLLVDALCYHELEYAVLVLGDGEIGHRTRRWIELRQVTATSLTMEHGHNLHRRFPGL